MTSINKVLVYGTLRSGESNHEVISDFIESSETITLNGFGMWNLGPFPVVFPIEGTDHIVGELVTLKETTLTEAIANLDELEGFIHENRSRNLYNRYKGSTAIRGELVEFYFYIGGERLADMVMGGRAMEIASGDWNDRVKQTVAN